MDGTLAYCRILNHDRSRRAKFEDTQKQTVHVDRLVRAVAVCTTRPKKQWYLLRLARVATSVDLQDCRITICQINSPRHVLGSRISPSPIMMPKTVSLFRQKDRWVLKRCGCGR